MRVPATLPLLALVLTCLPKDTDAQSESVFLQSIQCVGGPYGLQLPADARKLRKLGKVLREEVSEVERADGYTATRKTIYYSGLSLGVVEFSNDPSRFMVTFAYLDSPEWNRISPFKLRRPVAEARAILGKVAVGDPDLKKSYDSETEGIQFKTSGGVVTAVSYSCYSG